MCAGSEGDFWSGWKLGSPENSGAGEQHHQEWALEGQGHLFPRGPHIPLILTASLMAPL